MNIPNDNAQNYPFCILKFVVETLDTHFKKPTNQNPLMVLHQRIRKRYYKTLGTTIKKEPSVNFLSDLK